MSDQEALTYIEIDLPYCTLTYGVLPCLAVLGVTGAAPCFNTIKTCQSRTTFTNETVTLRFAVDADYLPSDIPAIPSITNVQFDPGTISLGENLGTRSTLTVTFKDHLDSDAGVGGDKYFATRGYNPYTQGTFWGRFRARQPYVFGIPIRLIQGFVGDAITDMETRNYVGDSFDGPDPTGAYTLVAKDVLRFATGDVSQAPIANTGFLSADIAANAGGFSVNSGAGAQYGSGSGLNTTLGANDGSFLVCVGGQQIMNVFRSGDNFAINYCFTTQVAHSAGDTVQNVLTYYQQDPANIIQDLLINYADVPSQGATGTAPVLPAWIPIADWLAETSTYLGQVFTGYIPQPTGVDQLISEIIQQAGLALWWDDQAELIKLQVLRAIPTDATAITADDMLAGTFKSAEQPGTRITQSWVNFGQIDPTISLTQLNNFRSVGVTADLQAEEDYGSPVIDTIYSRWIAQGGLTLAQKLGSLRVNRFVTPPRLFDFDLLRNNKSVVLGGGYNLEFWNLQNADGTSETVPIQVTRLTPQADRLSVEAWEGTSVTPSGIGNHTITIDTDSFEINLRNIHDQLYPAAVAGTNVICTINSDVTIGSEDVGTPAFNVGTWPAGVVISIVNNGLIQGLGGNGGKGGSKNNTLFAANGVMGGTAFYTRYAVSLSMADGEIYGGGGGGGGGSGSASGGGGGGGGGSGTNGGMGGAPGGGGGASTGQDGATGHGGPGGAGDNASGGTGGGKGAAGSSGNGSAPGNGGAAGNAIDGNSYVTISAAGDVRGPTIN